LHPFVGFPTKPFDFVIIRASGIINSERRVDVIRVVMAEGNDSHVPSSTLGSKILYVSTDQFEEPYHQIAASELKQTEDLYWCTALLAHASIGPD
jgi:hypothetical protein